MWVLYHYTIWLRQRLREVFWLASLPMWLIGGKKFPAWLMFLNPTNLRCHHWDGMLFLEPIWAAMLHLYMKLLTSQSSLEQIMHKGLGAGSSSTSRPSDGLWKALSCQCLFEKQTQPWLTLESLASYFLPHLWHLNRSALLQTERRADNTHTGVIQAFFKCSLW